MITAQLMFLSQSSVEMIERQWNSHLQVRLAKLQPQPLESGAWVLMPSRIYMDYCYQDVGDLKQPPFLFKAFNDVNQCLVW